MPQGTTVRDAETGKVLTDLIEHGQEFIVVAAVDRNIRFATIKILHLKLLKWRTRSERELQLELKILCGCRFSRLPSVGKSTLCAHLLKSVPTILRLLMPNLGMVRTNQENPFAEGFTRFN